MRTQVVDVDVLARVEGEGGIRIELEDGRPARIEFRVLEPPRFFEGIVRGRDRDEVPDLTARICGICPVAHQIGSAMALERASGAPVGQAIMDLRRLAMCGATLASHALHVHLLDGPDRLGAADVFDLARDRPDWVEEALRVKKIGLEIVRLVGGREVHPPALRVGGFHRAPERAALVALLPELAWARRRVVEQARILAEAPLPTLERDLPWVALRSAEGYPILGGRVMTSTGVDLDPIEFERVFVEDQVDRSTALHSSLHGRPYACGPLARVNLAFDQLGTEARALAEELGLTPPTTNPFLGILARLVEMVEVMAEAARLIEGHAPLSSPCADLPRRAGWGASCVEAPRGVLYHRYEVDEGGRIVSACVVTPTSQNQGAIEADLWAAAPEIAELSREDATHLAERVVRNHDPCISCATHSVLLLDA